jgi:hypothetical protein
MSTDRELLELAAKAAGYEPQGMEQGRMYLFGVQNGWNPLDDDGDALRLAVKLGMAVSVCLGMPNGDFTAILGSGFDSEKHRDDAYAATRRAIVRAAAEIGRAQAATHAKGGDDAE